MRLPAKVFGPCVVALLVAACGEGEVRPPAIGQVVPAPPVPRPEASMPAAIDGGTVDGGTVDGGTGTTTARVATTNRARAPVPPGWALPAKRPGPFPGVEVATVRAFDMSPRDGTRYPECMQVLDAKANLCRLVQGPGVQLSSAQLKQLLALLREPATYGGGSKCFEPHHGFVFYDAAEVPVAEVALCFECDMIRGVPELQAGAPFSHGVTPEAIGTFRKLCKELGLMRCE